MILRSNAFIIASTGRSIFGRRPPAPATAAEAAPSAAPSPSPPSASVGYASSSRSLDRWYVSLSRTSRSAAAAAKTTECSADAISANSASI